MTMTVTLLGTGTPWPDLNRQSAAVLVKIGKDNLLFDTGRGVVYQALKANIPLQTINPIFLTHHHSDHISDLYDVILSSWIEGRTWPLKIFGPPGTSIIVNALIEQVFAKDIDFRTRQYLDIDNSPLDGHNIAKLEIREITSGLFYQSDNWQVTAELVQHHYNADPPQFEWVCLGYRITSKEKSVVISGDTVPCEGLNRLASGADLLVQCCLCADIDVRSPMREHTIKYILPTASQVGKVAARAGVAKMMLTHIEPTASLDAMERDVRKEYSGEVIMGEDLLDIDV
jgi:ribonuclease BN (tRNA processing enzyme)